MLNLEAKKLQLVNKSALLMRFKTSDLDSSHKNADLTYQRFDSLKT